MTHRAPLDNFDHRDLRVAIRHGAEYGDAVNQMLVFPTEFEQVQRDYPILFRRNEAGDFYAVALLGLDRDENLFLTPQGWQARYIPAIQQRGPFIGDAGATGDAGAGAIHVDLDDARVGVEDGEPLFLPQGGDAPYLQHVARILDVVRRGSQAMAPFFASLCEHELIQPVALDIALDDGVSYQVPDVYTVARDRLDALGGEALARLHASGALRAAILASASLGNIDRLIELKTRKLAGEG